MQDIMKSAVLHSVRNMSIEALPIPRPEPGEVLIKVMACGLCGTDVHIYEGAKGAAENPWPIVLGHEFAGLVERVGHGVSGISPGERVCIDPNALCGRCTYCKNGMGHFCENMIGIGTTVNGGFSGYCKVPAAQVYKLSGSTTFEQGAMAEPLACCLHGIDMCDILPGDTVVVIGGGMIGLLMLQLARLCGAAKTILVEPVTEKREAALKLGCDVAIDPSACEVESQLEQLDVGRVGCVIECVGKPATISQAIRVAGKKSVVMMFGLTKPDETVPLFPYEIFQKEIAIKSSFINPYTIGRAVELIDSGRVEVESMVTACIPLEDLPKALADDTLRRKGKVLVKPWG